MSRFQVTGEKVTPDGEVVAGDGGKFRADSEDEAIQAFRDVHKPDEPGVWSWVIKATKIGD